MVDAIKHWEFYKGDRIMKLYDFLELFNPKTKCEIVEDGKRIYCGETGLVTVEQMMWKKVSDRPEAITTEQSILKIVIEEEPGE